jgi:O-antigen/teichoic acid export membrane protein
MVSQFFSIEQFAIYAFALVVVTMIYTFVRAASEVFFPHISNITSELQTQLYRLGESLIVIIWAALLAGYFLVIKIVEIYLPDYLLSLPILRILLCTVGFGSITQILHITYYKIYRQQSRYFAFGIITLVFAFVFNILAIKIIGTLESVAIATLISFGLWYVINELNFRSRLERSTTDILKSFTIICCYMALFWGISLLPYNFAIQMVIYIGTCAPLIWFFYHNKLMEIIQLIRKGFQLKG